MPVECYRLVDNKWLKNNNPHLTLMNKQRFMHSCCVVNDRIYAIGGRGDLPDRETISDFEYISAQKFINGEQVQWTIIEI